MSLCLGLTDASVSHLKPLSQPSGLWTRIRVWIKSCVSSTAGRWPGTTPCVSSCARSSCCRRRIVPAMPGRRWKSWWGWDGQLRVRREGREVPAQEAPPSPVILRNGQSPQSDPHKGPIVKNHWDERWTSQLMPLVLGEEPEAEQPGYTDGKLAVAEPACIAPRKPTFLQKERWKAIQKARRKGMSLRAIQRELGIHRATIRN